MWRERFKWLLLPGLNLHARLRGRLLPEELGRADEGAERRVLDAGCGNGLLAYHAYTRGNRVDGVSIKDREVSGNRALFHEYLAVPEDRLRFEKRDLYDIDGLGRPYDEIVCTEVLEHIRDDEGLCRAFWKILKPGGVLHLCCPNAGHPDHRAQELDEHEGGGHVRPGYTLEGYRALLEPIGFRIERVRGLGGPLRQACNKWITRAQDIGGVPLGAAVFAGLWPLASLDRDEPELPYSLYVRAVKPDERADTPPASPPNGAIDAEASQ
jgi:SAM-dependent methyltransferase